MQIWEIRYQMQIYTGNKIPNVNTENRISNANTGNGKITRWKTDHKKNPQGDFERIKIREDEEIFCLGLTELLKELKDLEVSSSSSLASL